MFKRLILTIAILAGAIASASVVSPFSQLQELPEIEDPLLDSGLYVVRKDRKIHNRFIFETGGLRIKEKATVAIYIPKGVTLEVSGHDALPPDSQYVGKLNGSSYETVGARGNNINNDNAGLPAAAGIFVPTNSTLIITGEGKLIAKGGNGADGMQGFTMNGYDPPMVDSSEARTGGGGRGGFGGGGAAAAIGGAGGKGGKGGDECDTYRKKYPDNSNFENFTEGNNNRDGNPAESGSNGMDMGTVYLIGTVNVEVTGGKNGSKGGTGGNHSGWNKSDCLNEQTDDWIAGPGGGGGGGGAGCGVMFSIGGGAGGGGGGGGGATGSFTVFDDWDGSKYGYGGFEKCMVGGNGGKGGKGPANVSDVNGKDGERTGASAVTKKSNDYGHDVSCKEGGAGGNAGESGKNGSLFIAPGVTVTSGDASIPAYTSSTVPVSGYECIQYKVTFVITGDRRDVLTQTLGCAYPNNRPTPTRPGYIFRGYFSGRNGTGDKWYDENGELVRDGLVCSSCGDVTLYASWGLEGRSDKVVVNPGQVLEYDGLIDEGRLVQPDTGNLFEVKRGGKLLLKNVYVSGSDLGCDSVILNGGELFVTNCVFKENYSPYGWGAVYRDLPGAKATFYGCTFKGNSALEGGVIAAEGSEVSVVYSTFLDNITLLDGDGHRAENCSAPYVLGQAEGAIAIAIDNAKLNLIGCTVASNLCHSVSGCNIAVYNSTNSEDIVLMNNIITRESNKVQLNGNSYSWIEPVVNGLNNKGYVDGNNLVRESIDEILSSEITREVDGVEHIARRPVGAARIGGDSGRLYQGGDFSRFSTTESAETPLFLSVDLFGQYPLDGWYGAITGNTLQYLINRTPAGETLEVPAGMYDPVYVDKAISIVGEDRDTTFINGDMLEQCLIFKPGGESATISDFSFIYGKGVNGGGVTGPEAGAGYLTNCLFSACVAENGGGAAFLKTASQCVFTNCMANVEGGGTYKCDLIDRSFYQVCRAVDHGGAVGEDKIVRASLLSQNIAKQGGGGYKTKFYNCTFDNNKAPGVEECQGTAFSSWLIGCVLYGNKLPTQTSQDETTRDNMRASAEYKSNMFYDAPRDFHLRLRDHDKITNKRTPVDHSAISVGDHDSYTMQMAETEGWLDIEGNPLVSAHRLTGEKFMYGGCYAFAPTKISGTVVTGEEEWYDYTNAKTSLREAIEVALTDPAYMTNETAVITFSDDLKPKDHENYVILTLGEEQIDVEAFTNRTLVIQGPTDRAIAINGNHEYRAFRVFPQNNLKVENLLFQNCLGSRFGISSQAPAHGGAILNHGNLSVSNCVFVANTTDVEYDLNNKEYPIGYGGAIATMSSGTNSASTIIRNSSFDHNKAQRGGALYTDKNTRTDVFFSTFGDNIAIGSGSTEAAGGAIAMDLTNTTTNSVVTLVNCTLVGNSVPEKENAGGAIVARSGLTLLDSIVLGNFSGGITNDVVMSGGSNVNKANARMISTAIGTRTKESNLVDYSDEVLYKVEDLEDFLSTTNSVSTETVLPHIIYPTSTGLEHTALLSKYASDELFGYDARNNSGYTITTNTYINVHGEEVTTYLTNYTFRAEAIRGMSRELNRNGKAFEVDQTGGSLEGRPIFGSTLMSADPRINVRSDESSEETEENPENSLMGVKVIIIDYLGNTNKFSTASEAIKAYKYGDTIQAVDAEDDETLDCLDALYNPMKDFVAKHDWYDFVFTDDYTTYALLLNEKAKPIAVDIEMNFSTTKVVMRTVENMKPGLWYALGYADSPAGPYKADNWVEGKVDGAGNMCFDEPLMAPKIGTSTFYRVIVAPYPPAEKSVE